MGRGGQHGHTQPGEYDEMYENPKKEGKGKKGKREKGKKGKREKGKEGKTESGGDGVGMFQQQRTEQDKECRIQALPTPVPQRVEGKKNNDEHTYDSQERTLRLPMRTRLAFDRSHSSSRTIRRDGVDIPPPERREILRDSLTLSVCPVWPIFLHLEITSRLGGEAK